MAEENFYTHYYQKALSIGEYFCRKSDYAQEITQLTTIKLFLWRDKIEKPDKWVYRVARNYSLQLLKKIQTNTEFIDSIGQNETEASFPELIEHLDLDNVLHEIPLEFINTGDFALARDYFIRELEFNDLVERYSLSPVKLSEKLYNIRQEIILYLKFNSGFKIVGKIPGTRLNRNIMNFIHKLKESLEMRDFTEIIRYMDKPTNLEDLKKVKIVQKVLRYELHYLEPGIYRLHVIYLLEGNIPYTISLKIKLTNWKKIRVISELKLPSKVIKISHEDVDDYARMLLIKKYSGENLLNNDEICEVIKNSKATEIKI